VRPTRTLRILGSAAALVAVVLVAAACGGGDDASDEPVVVTFQVVDEEFRVLLTDPADIHIAHQLLAGEDAPSIPNGIVVRGETGVNEGWSWSIDPDAIEFADVTIEVCDGLPSDVEAGTITSDRYCPWSAVVVSVEPAGSSS
jgi:hypothetical protein